jgi:hypothetical protein
MAMKHKQTQNKKLFKKKEANQAKTIALNF